MKVRSNRSVLRRPAAMPFYLGLFLMVTVRAQERAADLPTGAWEAVTADRGPAFEALLRLHGSGWSVWTDHRTGTPSLIVGPGLDVGGPVAADAAGIARARALMEEHRELLGVDDPSAFVLERAVEVRNPHGHAMVTINFKQTCDGLDVWHQAPGGAVEHLALVRFVFNGTLGRLVLLGSDAVSLEKGSGPFSAAETGPDPFSVPGVIKHVEERRYISVRGGRSIPVREVEVITSDPPHDWRFLYDARTGALVERRDDLRHADFTGTMTIGALNFPPGPGAPGSTFTRLPAQALQVNLRNWGFTNTDLTGFWRIPGPQGVEVDVLTAWCLGRYAEIRDQSGNGNLQLTATALNTQPTNVGLNPFNNAEFETAEATAYYWVTATRYFIAGIIPSHIGGAVANVNLAQTCTSFYDGIHLNFSRSGGGCNNAAYQEIVGHEYGHLFHRQIHGSTNPPGFSEGIADHIGAYLADGERQFGRNFTTAGGNVRDYRFGQGANATQWPCLGCAAHKAGEAWAGFTLDLRDALVARLGAPGATLAARITIAQYASNPSDEVAAVTNVYLQDDNDANLTNGTPDCADITAAARRHNLPVPVPLPLSCGVEPPDPVPEWRPAAPEAALNSAQADNSPTLDDSQLTIWFASNRAPGSGFDVYTSTRASVAAPWSAPVAVPALNSPLDDLHLSVSGAGLEMILGSTRSGGLGGEDLWVSTRPSTLAPWGVPTPLAVLNSSTTDFDPCLSADGEEVFFASDRAGSLGGAALWTSTRIGNGGFNPPTRIFELDSSGVDRSPALSHDGTRLLFASTRGGNSDWWLARRAGRGQPWTLVRSVNELNAAVPQSNGDVLRDDFSFFFTRNGANVEIFRADRILPRIGGPTSARVGTVQAFSIRRDPGNVGAIAIAIDPLPPTVIPGVQGILLTVPLILLVNAVMDANGLVTVPVGIANVPGFQVYFQGLAQDAMGQLYLSNRLTFMHLP
jgi:hypothetical protein